MTYQTEKKKHRGNCQLRNLPYEGKGWLIFKEVCSKKIWFFPKFFLTIEARKILILS